MYLETLNQDIKVDFNNQFETSSFSDDDLDTLETLLLPETLTLPCFSYEDEYPIKRKRKREQDPTNLHQTPVPSFYLDQNSEICGKCNQVFSTLPVEDVVVNNKTGCVKLPVVFSSGDGAKHWSEREKTFLIGIIFDTFYRRGTLVPSKVEKDFAWEKIKKTFDQACMRYEFLTRHRLGESKCHSRTKLALLRHFKHLKAAVATHEIDDEDETLPMFKRMHLDWENSYNQNNVLTCSEKRFSKFVSQLQKLSVHSCHE